ncbi:MAG: OB-fold protein [Beijerinckiaceae bacterium]
MPVGDDLSIVLFLIGSAIAMVLTAVSAAGWKHPLFITALLVLAAGLFFAALGWPWVKTFSPLATATISDIARNPVSWFVIVMVAIVAIAHLPARDTFGRQLQVEQLVKNRINTTAKIYIDVSTKYLTELCNDKTELQCINITATYVGKWIIVSGVVKDVSALNLSIWPYISVMMNDTLDITIHADFDKSYSEHISWMIKGTKITVHGQIEKIRRYGISLGECYLEATN